MTAPDQPCRPITPAELQAAAKANPQHYGTDPEMRPDLREASADALLDRP